ncbi:S1C family serine protease [Methylovorus menthalis]|uniref:S1C family serine protease n=1 Tax=Methylovorus menthalis TaxID=1002227 RepID=UPI001E487C14|nr:S1C family serine protease [Methylovorus menthalis]MCB4811048.1 S1C family serine protease [Methylovorus menthalis]
MRYLSSALLIALLAGCVPPATIKPVSDQLVESLPANTNIKPIQFSKIVVKMKRGEKIGALQMGLLCVGQGSLDWKGGKLSIDSDEFTEAFKDELEKASFKTVGDSNALFEDPSTWKSEILVAGLVKDLKANICYPNAGFGDFNSAKGEAYLKVDWQIYSKLDRAVVHSVITEGAAKSTTAVGGGDINIVLNAFAQATRNLLADDKFRSIVMRGGQTINDTVTVSGEQVVISNNKAKRIGNNPSEWSSAVATVFAGNGHGSGFLISDNLILTNQHVVGDAKAVNVKFGNGLELVGNVIATNSARDVALVKLNAVLPKFFNISKTLPDIGAEVYAIGTPLDQSLSSTISKGIVSNIRDIDSKNFIQSDVNIRPGNSGGPLLDKNGNVIGIAVSGVVINQVSQGINFFIPINDALKVLNAIYASGS